MTIDRLELTKRKLSAVPPAERRLLILLGHASNEINVLQKLVVMSRHGQLGNKTVDYVQTWQTLFLMRLLISKLHEAWELFEVRFQSRIAHVFDHVPAQRASL